MIKRLLFTSLLTATGSGATLALAATTPKLTTPGDTTWYAMQFCKQSNVVSAIGEGQEAKTAVLTGADDQMWYIEGDETQGYTITSRNGQRLFVTGAAQNEMFKTAAAPTGNDRFIWDNSTSSSYSGSYVLSPKENTGVYLNQWQGAGTGKRLGLWNDKTDDGSAFIFIDQTTVNKQLGLDQQLPLIPYPRELTMGEGKVAVKGLTGINFVDDATKRYAQEFADQLALVSGHKLAVTTDAPAMGIKMALASSEQLKHMAYKLDITQDGGVTITASDSTGFFYGIQTLKQLLPMQIYGKTPAAEAAWELPCLAINDAPELEHRGIMIDVARHFFSKTEMERILDIMASYKMSRLHWHLTDDQGWRVEIPEYPRLTTVGAIRKASLTNVGGSQNFYDDTEYGRGMFYTLDDLREVVKYAKDRNIEILPEVDLPGHMVAAVTSYPELSCDPTKTYEVRVDAGISKDVLNVGRDETIDFLKCVLGHIADVFPYPYIHLGGDECPTDQWTTNADCLRRVQEEGLSGVQDLQSWLVNKLGKYLRDEKGKGIVVWDEVLKHWNNDNEIRPIVMCWNNPSAGVGWSLKAAQYGLKSIRTPHSSVYLDFMQVPVSMCDVNEGYQGGWGPNSVNDLPKVYNLDPLDELNGSGLEDKCIGVQGNLWAETLVDSLQLEYQLFPRAIALAETGWLPASDKSWNGFLRRLQSQDEILDLRGYNYAKHYFDVEESADELALIEAKQILAESKPGCVGYPSQDEADKLKAAIDAVDGKLDDATLVDALKTAVAAYKKAAIVKPEEGKMYEIVSASTYYNAKYAGSTIYAQDKAVKFHYTAQTEPEEVWQFTPSGTGYLITNMMTGLALKMPTANGSAVTLDESGTPLRVDQAKATTASKQYTYVPGVTNISAVTGYYTTSVRRLTADASGLVKAAADGALCFQGTWYVREITDFSAQLEGLVKKSQLILLTATPDQPGEPTTEALTFLTNSVITPAQADLAAASSVDKAKYEAYVKLYKEYLDMTHFTAVDKLDETYYRLQNGWFTAKYAAATASNTVAPRDLDTSSDYFVWQVKKNDDGTIQLINKQTGTAAYPASITESANIMVGQPYNWAIAEQTTDEGKTGFVIVDESDTYSWYTNPAAWANNVIFKPKAWGASIWNFVKLDTPVGIENLTAGTSAPISFYDLSGRRVAQPKHGVFITSKGKKVVK